MVDPGVFIAAAISHTHGSATVALVGQWRRGRFDLVASDRLVAGFAAVAQRPWFGERVSSQQVDRLVADLCQRAVVVGEPENVWPVSRDRDDDYLVALARSTAADALVCGDGDLTDLLLADVPILTADVSRAVHSPPVDADCHQAHQRPARFGAPERGRTHEFTRLRWVAADLGPRHRGRPARPTTSRSDEAAACR